MLCRRSAVRRLAAALAAFLIASSPAARAADAPSGGQLTAEVRKQVAADYSSLESLYKHLHTHPELSLQEEQSAARIAKELKDSASPSLRKSAATASSACSRMEPARRSWSAPTWTPCR